MRGLKTHRGLTENNRIARAFGTRGDAVMHHRITSETIRIAVADRAFFCAAALRTLIEQTANGRIVGRASGSA